MSDWAELTRALRDALAAGRRDEALAFVSSLPPQHRRAVCRPLVAQAKAISAAQVGSKAAKSETFGDEGATAWRGPLKEGHADAATVVMLGSKAAPQAAKVWPLPSDWAFAERIIPALFPDDLDVFVAQWSADFVSNPKHWDRNHRRAVMFEWIEQGIALVPAHDGAVLMLVSGFAEEPGKRLLRWLLAHPVVTEELFARIFVTAGVKGASLAQVDETYAGEPLRRVVIPGLVSAGVWDERFVVQGVRSALDRDLPAYQHRWFLKLADGLGA